MGKKILVTGGTGLVGKTLCKMLQDNGFEVCILSRSKNSSSPYPIFTWDYKKGHLEAGALKGIDAIIHLAGAGVADKRWSKERKQEILESRTLTSNLLFEQLKSEQHQVKTIITASAIGIYGMDTGASLITEEGEIGNDYLAQVTKAWEASTSQFSEINIRLVQLRIGVVLNKVGGALKELMKPPIAAPLSTGNQFMSWIHFEDLCNMFLWALKNEHIQGAYNAVTPNSLTNRAFTKKAARIFKKPFVPIPVPKFLLNIILGEMADIVSGGSKISSDKIEKAGFEYKFTDFEAAVKDLKTK